MKAVTNKQRENALYVRDVLWPSVPEDRVTKHLAVWQFGACACLGGWVARSPYFQAQGVTSLDDYGVPVLVPSPDEVEYGMGVADVLFGDPTLFWPRGFLEDGASDHAVVARRINRLIAESVVIEAEVEAEEVVAC